MDALVDMNTTLQALIIGFFLAIVLRLIHRKQLNEPPVVPYRYPLVQNANEFANDPGGFLKACHDKYGPIFTIHLFGSPITIVGKEHAAELLSTADFSFRDALEERHPILRICNISGYPKEQRICFNDLIRKRLSARLDVYGHRTQDELYQAFDKLVGPCDKPTVVEDPYLCMRKCIAHTVANVLFGELLSKDAALVNTCESFAYDVSKGFSTLPFLKLIHPSLHQKWLILRYRYGANPTTKHRNVLRERIKTVCLQRIAEEKQSDGNWKAPNDLLQDILNDPYIDKNNVDYEWIVSHVMIIILVSIHSTSQALTNCLHEYANNPGCQQELLEEQRVIAPDVDAVLTVHQLNDMEKLDSFVRESLRLTGNYLQLYHRMNASSYTFGNGVQVPKGRTCAVYNPDIVSSEELQGPNPTQFDAFRHVGKGKPATKVERTYLIFGLGKHACPGRAFAVHDIKLMMSKIIRGYEVRLPEGKQARKRVTPAGFTAPADCPVVFTKC